MKLDGTLLLTIIDARVETALATARLLRSGMTTRSRDRARRFGPDGMTELLQGIDREVRSLGSRLVDVEGRLGVEAPPDADEEVEVVDRPGPRSTLPKPPEIGEGPPGGPFPAQGEAAKGQAYLDALREAKAILGPGAIAVAAGKGEVRRFCVADREGDSEHCYGGASWAEALAAAREGVKRAPPPLPLPTAEDVPLEVARAFADELWGEGVGSVSLSLGDSSRTRCCVTNGPPGTRDRKMILEGSFLECFAKHLGVPVEEARDRALKAARAKGLPVPKSAPPAPSGGELAPEDHARLSAEAPPVAAKDLSPRAAQILAQAFFGPKGWAEEAVMGGYQVGRGSTIRGVSPQSYILAFVKAECGSVAYVTGRALEVASTHAGKLQRELTRLRSLPIPDSQAESEVSEDLASLSVPTVTDAVAANTPP